MENKKYLPIKIVHLLLMVAAIVFCCLSLTKIGTDTTLSSNPGTRTVTYILEIIALISGVIYLAFGYKKNAAAYYKTFMVIMVITQAFMCYRQMITGVSEKVAILNIIPFAMLVILATGKDLGKATSYVIAAIPLACRLIILILDITTFGVMPNTGFTIISHAVSNVLLAGTAAFMVTGKYLDKAERGTK